MLDMSIVIVNWNAKDLLAKCLQCVDSTVKKISYETYVVDNASTDGSQDMVRRDFPNVKLIANSQNVGFATANNQAMKVASGRYVLLLNSDAFVKEDTLDYMVTFMDEHPDAGMASCKLLYEDGKLQPSCTSFPTLMTEFLMAFRLDKLFPKSKFFGKYLMTYWNFDDVRDVDVIMGAFMMVRANIIPQIGLLDENYFMYSEEADWCYRFKKTGWEIYFTPQVEAIHLWGGSSKPVVVKMHIQLYRSRVLFFRKNYGKLQAFLYKGLIGVICLLRIVPGSIYYLFKTEPTNQHKQQAYRQLLRVLPSL